MMETQFSQALEKIIQEFQTRNDIDIHEIATRSREGQRLRGELPVKLKEGAGLNYKEIAGIEILFSFLIVVEKLLKTNYN